ncbi:MAG: hypothetical protein UY82_C0023G0001 [Candidatus Uhrbacteria bacterium GW2011_GWC2_53_7]|uniref:HEPN domain-containing protein n=1 Tax=Candidatus Uhrbacteria bacterium GW2011_GWC2_53_7 TaxID=1618986 RepID=A0A0G2A6E3_9BACT|nr:MAG: hypothetical protein UY82_C0023G0001 [Candidatus Uhrbacteria bacterium GW2011_GWC2_53_7]
MCDKITEYYTIDRYPFFLDSQLSEEEIRDSLAEAKKLVIKLTQSYIKPRNRNEQGLA